MATTKTRIYTVINGEQARLVRAANVAQARNHVARESITARIASQDELLALASKVEVEDSTAELD